MPLASWNKRVGKSLPERIALNSKPLSCGADFAVSRRLVALRREVHSSPGQELRRVQGAVVSMVIIGPLYRHLDVVVLRQQHEKNDHRGHHDHQPLENKRVVLVTIVMNGHHGHHVFTDVPD
jgi:hypothetical protein